MVLLLAAVLCMTAFSVPAFAGGGEPGEAPPDDLYTETQTGEALTRGRTRTTPLARPKP